MTTKPALQKILKGILHTDEEVRLDQENARKSKPHSVSRLANKDRGKVNIRKKMTK
jgi:predicted RNA-binding protein YlqC (UPF0109 family)